MNLPQHVLLGTQCGEMTSPFVNALRTWVFSLHRTRVIPISFSCNSVKNASNISNPVKSTSFTPEKHRHKHHGLGYSFSSKKRPICFFTLDLKDAVLAKKIGASQRIISISPRFSVFDGYIFTFR